MLDPFYLLDHRLLPNRSPTVIMYSFNIIRISGYQATIGQIRRPWFRERGKISAFSGLLKKLNPFYLLDHRLLPNRSPTVIMYSFNIIRISGYQVTIGKMTWP